MSIVNRPKKGATRLPFTRGDHVEVAQRLRAHLEAVGPIVHSDGATYQYTEPVFSQLDRAASSRIVQGFAGASIGQKGKCLELKASDVKGAIQLLEDLIADPTFFADAPPGIAFEDCFVQVEPTAIRQLEHSPENRARFAYPFEYVEDPCPARLLQFFGEVWHDDPDAQEKIQFVQEFLGACLLGIATRYQRALVQVGQGANGKSVLGAIADAAMPPGSVANIPPQDFGQEYRRAMLAGRLLNVVNELPESDILDSESFKAIVAGDPVTGRHIRQAPFSYRPKAGHMFSANRLPGTTDQTHGFWRRMVVITFNRVFASHEQDSGLADRIIEMEMPHVVSWCVQGGQRVLRKGRYTEPNSSADAKAEWKRMADQVASFVDERCLPLALDNDIRSGEGASSLYKAYRRWAMENGHRTLASNKFGRRMADLGYPAQHTRDGNLYAVRLQLGAESHVE